jgi:DNA-directed RNA polymerase specialized sigma24 family protein
VPEPQAAERKARARQADRRRQAVSLLNIAGGTMIYAVRQLGNGIGPEQARVVAADAADELEQVAEALRRLTRPGPAERRALARQLAAMGWTTRRIAARVGVSERAVRYYVAGRACP